MGTEYVTLVDTDTVRVIVPNAIGYVFPILGVCWHTAYFGNLSSIVFHKIILEIKQSINILPIHK